VDVEDGVKALEVREEEHRVALLFHNLYVGKRFYEIIKNSMKTQS